MNLYELDELLNQLINENDKSNDELISFYQRKRIELLAAISLDINNKLKAI